mmetsp:Transcript_5663/g.7925  ORF Transcript_5663/g.7925 Transcript_5663/m.7925 type:complete len:203 (-) Transcript_5663:95-703(-)
MVSHCFEKLVLICLIAFITVDAQLYSVTIAYSDSKCSDVIGGNVILNNYCTPVYYANGLTKYISTNCTSSAINTYQCNDKECSEGCFKYSSLPTSSQCSEAPDNQGFYQLSCSSVFPETNQFDMSIKYYDQESCNGTIYYWGFGTDKTCVNGEYFSCTENSVLLFACADNTCQDASTCSLADSLTYGCNIDPAYGSVLTTCF